MPIRDWIPDPVERWWDRGVADPLQFLDSATPGNWRQNGQFDPAGLAAGAGQIASGGIANARLTEPLIQRLLGGRLFGGRAGDIGRGVSDPLRYADNTQSISDDAMNYVPGTSTLNRSEQQMADERNQAGNTSDGGGRGGPRLGRGESAGGGNMGGVTLGLGQLGRGGDEAIAAHMRSLFNRPQAER